MKKLFGSIVIILGVSGIVMYFAGGMAMSREEKTAVFIGFFMIAIGFIIIYGAWKKYPHNDKK